MKGHVTVPQITAFCPTAQTVTVCHVTSRHGTLPRRNLSQGKLPYGTLPSGTSRQVTSRHVFLLHGTSPHGTFPHGNMCHHLRRLVIHPKIYFIFLNLCYCTLVVKAYSALVRIVARGTSHSVKFSQRS